MSTTIAGRDAQAAPLRSRSRLSIRLLAGIVALLTVALVAVWYGHDWWKTGRFIQTTDDAYVGGNVTTLSPHVGGFVTALLVADNEHVQRGQLVARLDRRDYEAALGKAQAVVAARVAALANLRSHVVLQQTFIREAAANQAAKVADAAFTRIDGARYAYLATTSAGSRQEAQKSMAAKQIAEAEVAASVATLDGARQQLAVLDTQIAEAQAEIGQAQSELRTANLNLSYTDIRSPVEGFVGNRAAQVGAYVAEGAYLLSIIPAHDLWIDANFKEDQLSRMVPGQLVTAEADVAPGRIFNGRVQSLAPGTGALFSIIPPENATGNFTKIVQRVPVRIALDASDSSLGRLRPGLSMLVRVDTRRAP